MGRSRVLTVAGSDPGGGAGVQADLKTFAAWRCYGMAVVTALTAQNTVGVRAVHAVPAEFVATCLDAVLEDCAPAATKTGMLFDPGVIEVVAGRLRAGRAGPVVVDPVMVATSGDRLLRDDALDAMRTLLLPIAAVVTPNVPEAEILAGFAVHDEATAWLAAEAIGRAGAGAVLVKGGHMRDGPVVRDYLLAAGRRIVLEHPRLPIARPHGTGCTLSAAIAAGLARGLGVEDAVRRASDWLHAALAAASPIGAGGVPLDHCVPVEGVGP